MKCKIHRYEDRHEGIHIINVITIRAKSGQQRTFGPVQGEPVLDKCGKVLYIAGSYKDLINVVYRYNEQADKLSIVAPRYITKIRLDGERLIAEWAEGGFGFSDEDFREIDFAPLPQFLRADVAKKIARKKDVLEAVLCAAGYQFWIADGSNEPIGVVKDITPNGMLLQGEHAFFVIGLAPSNTYPVKVAITDQPPSDAAASAVVQEAKIEITSGKLLIGNLFDAKEKAPIRVTLKPGVYQMKVVCYDRGIDPRDLKVDGDRHALLQSSAVERYEIFLRQVPKT